MRLPSLARLPIRTALLVPMTEGRYRARIYGTAFSAALQISVFCVLWTAVHCGSTADDCQGAGYARTYSALAVLMTCTRAAARESVRSRIRDGSLAFWFLRPMAPQRYQSLRAAGGFLYNLLWLVPATTGLVALGLVQPPASAGALLLSLWCLAIGQVIAFYLGTVLELVCFWTLANYGITRAYYFFQDLLSGAAIPLWLFPQQVRGALRFLPFNTIVDLPISVYASTSTTPGILLRTAGQLAWAALLGLCVRIMWVRASRRIPTEGG